MDPETHLVETGSEKDGRDLRQVDGDEESKALLVSLVVEYELTSNSQV